MPINCRFLIASFILIQSIKVIGATYSEVKKAGINYLIAAIGIDSIKKTECAYVFKDSKFKSLNEIKNSVTSRLNIDDKKEITKILSNPESDLEIDATLKELKKKFDEKTACGLVSSYAIQALQESETNWQKITK